MRSVGAALPGGAECHDADVLIVGAGLAGLTTALSVSRRRVTILCLELPPAAAASAFAQGGIAAAVGEDDDPELHAQDTIRAGAGECSVPAVQRLCFEAVPAIRWLETQGVKFDQQAGRWALHREAGHQRARVLHAGGDATGASLVDALYRAACRSPAIEFWSGCSAVALLQDSLGIAGVVGLDSLGRPLRIRARDTVLATGGLGQLYNRTTNPRSACGDGLAMALAAGVHCSGLEFVQFHPTALASDADPLPLVTEALRGAGAKLVDDSGIRFMESVHPAAELAPRDVVARAIWNQLQTGHRVYLDATGVFGESDVAFPTVRALCASAGIDPAREPIPIVPAAHYHMGGIVVDAEGRSSIPRLWACGEVACSGVHGANRLASNSLLEAVVFGRRLGAALDRAEQGRASEAGASGELRMAGDVADPDATALQIDAHVWATLRRLMWEHLGIARHAVGLQRGLDELARLSRETPAGQILLHGRLRLARAMMAAALARRESRGAHLRTDTCLA